MRYIAIVLTILTLGLFSVANLSAQDRFDRSALIHADSLDIGGFGNLVAGVDLDGDGRMEIYAVNDDWFDKIGLDLTPRIYKYEQDDEGNWQTVWSTPLDLNFQNTWPALAVGDLDKDGKGEIIWGPVNNFGSGTQPNPKRIVVFETPGDGSDVMGIDNGDGTYRPNAFWTIVDDDNHEQRPIRWHIVDIDHDGTDEIVAGCRRGDGIQIYSVDNIPDNGDSSEVWTLEFTGLTGITFYDIGILDDWVVGIRSNGDVYRVWWDATGDSFAVADPQVGLAGRGSWKSVQTGDFDGDGQDEMILASWSSSDNDVYLLTKDADSLKSYKIVDVPSDGYRSYGGALGDVDNDGNLDFVFGTRSSTPNALIYRVEYQGGDITSSASWTLTAIDSLVWPALQYDIFAIANLDDDPEEEVIYSGIPRGLSSTDEPQPIVILENIPNNQPVITEVMDVPNDQGRYVWLEWKSSQDDGGARASNNDGDQLTVFAPKNVQIPDELANGRHVVRMPVEGASSAAAAGDITKYVVWRVDDGVPVQVAEVTPIQSVYYAAVVPTLGDGEDWAATYFVTAHTADVTTFWKSFEKTGVSEDNLIPTAPSVVAQVEETGTGLEVVLQWDELPDPDINYFSIRRSTDPGFDPNDPSTEIGATTDLNFVDNTVQEGQVYYYRVVAYDFNGNQGEFSNEVAAQVTGIEDDLNAMPKEFALYQNYPNPFNPSTTIAFDLPKQAEVVVAIYNVMGQKVRTLVNGSLNAGHHEVVWDGRNDFGTPVAGGVYIYTIKAGDFTKSMKMTLIK